MSTWEKGRDTITRQLADGDLQRVQGGQADGKPWLDRARKTLRTAEQIVESDPESGYILAYSSTRPSPVTW